MTGDKRSRHADAAHLVGDGDAGLVQDRPGVVAGGLVGVAAVVLQEGQLKRTWRSLVSFGVTGIYVTANSV